MSLYEAYLESCKAGGRKDVTVQLHIQSDDPKRHMTLTYLGDITSKEQFDGIEEILREPMPAIKLVVLCNDYFGPNKDIPVTRVTFNDDEVSQHYLRLFHKLHEKYGVCEPGMPSKFYIPNYHISMFGDNAESPFCYKQGDILICDQFRVKRLRADAFYVKDLELN